MWCHPPNRLPISTGNVGIDPVGQVQVYAAPRVVHAKCTVWPEWPAWPGWWAEGIGWKGPPPPRPWGAGCGCGSGRFGDALAAVLTSRCP